MQLRAPSIVQRVFGASLIAVAVWAAGAAVPARATNPTSQTLGSSASVVASCVIKSTGSINLGQYVPTSGSALQGSGQLALTCTKGDAVSVAPVSGGTTLSGGGASLSYALYADAAATKMWGSGPTYAQVNFDANVYFTHEVTLGASNQSQCTALAAGGLYVWNPTSNGLCWYGWAPSGTTAYYSNGLNVAANTLYVGGAFVAGGNDGNYLIAPTGTTRVGTTGYVYNTVVATGTGNALTGTSAGVATPLTLTYYAKVPAGQDVSAGAYTDTVTVQVSF